MKLILIRGYDNDNSAALFEDEYGDDITLELWQRIKQYGNIEVKGEILEAEAFEFGQVDTAFVNFMLDELVDEDILINTNFFVVKE